VNVLKQGDLVRRRAVGGALNVSRRDHRLGLVIRCYRENPSDLSEIKQLQVQFIDTQEKKWFYEHQLENAVCGSQGEKNV
jgi:hypothetical protein